MRVSLLDEHIMAKKSENKSNQRILLVDDDAEIIESLRLALEAHDYEVLIARDGNQGLALIEREAPDLVILDMMMPKRSGFLVLERLKRMGEKKQRIIMITANEGAGTRPTPKCSAWTTTSASLSRWIG